MPSDLKKYLETGILAAREAGKILLDKLDSDLEIEFKGEINLVTDADNASQKKILEILIREFPDHEFLAEEAEERKLGNTGHLWIIDPLDGTTNYAHGYRCFCVSIALMIDGDLVLGVIYDPCTDELYTAVKDGGAYLNGKQIKTTGQSKLDYSLLSTGFPYDIRDGKMNNIGLFNHLIMRAQAVRRDGSAALDMAYLAAGRYDGFWELKLHPWDVAAGIVIIKEAGGRVTDFTGNEFELTNLDILASNGFIHDEMMDEIAKVHKSDW